MSHTIDRFWKQAAVVALLVGLDLAVSLPIMGETYRPFKWMSLAPAGATLYPALPRLRVSPAKVKASGQQGGVPPNAQISVRNEGGGKMGWKAASGETWLTVVPNKGNSTGEWDRVALVFRSEGLGFGTHTALVTVSSAAVTNSPIQVAVVLKQQYGRPPAAPRLLAPPAGSVIPFTNRLDFSWAPAPRAQEYRVFAGKDGKTFTNVTVKGELTTNLTVAAPFRSGVYTWMVMGLNNVGPGPWSTTVTFRVSERLMSPGGGERLDGTNPPVFRWESTPGATLYQARLAAYEAPDDPRNPTNANGRYRTLVEGPAVRDGDGNWTPAGVTFQTNSYRWQVREKTGAAWAPWSTPAYFRIGTPASPKPTAPARGAVTGKRPVFEWTPGLDPEPVLFEIRVWKDGAIRKVFSEIAGSSFAIPAGAALPGPGTVSWQIRGYETAPDSRRLYSPWTAAVPFAVN